MVNKRNIVKGILILFVIILLLLMYGWVKKESFHLVSVEHVVPEVSQKEIITSGHETIIKSFKTVEDVKWINGQQLLIYGSLESTSKYYVFDLNQQILRPFAYTRDVKDSKDNLIDSLGGDDIVLNHSALEMQVDNTQFTIAENIGYKDEDLYQISDDGSKLLYYDALSKSLVTYHIDNRKYKTILKNVPVVILDHFHEKIKLSPLGGYISIEYVDEALEENFFSIYGADSGKIYGEKIHGIDVAWSKNDLYLAYFYTKESEKINNASNKIVSKRVGYYDVNKQKIKYLDSTPMEKEMVSKLYWNDTKTAVLVGEVNETFKINGLLINDFIDFNLYEIPLMIDAVGLEASINLLWDHPYVWAFIDEKNGAQVYKVDVESGDIEVYSDLKPFSLDESQGLYYYYEDGKMITFENDKIVLSDIEKVRYAHIDDESFKVIPHPQMKGFALWLDQKNVIKIVINN